MVQLRKLFSRMDDLSIDDGKYRVDVLELLIGHGEVILREGDDIGKLPQNDGSLHAGFLGEPATALGIQPKRFLATETIGFGIQ